MTLQRRPASPFGELMALRNQMDRLFEEGPVFGRRGWPVESLQQMPVDISSTKDELVIHASMPGVKPEDVDITVDGSLLTISGESRSERNDEQGQGGIVSEIRWGSVSRSFTLPEGLEADRAQASFNDGILTLRIPKTEQVKPRQIRIQASGQPKQVGESGGNGQGNQPGQGQNEQRDASRGSIG